MHSQAEWTRETPWRQGHVLCQDACSKLGLKHPEHPDDTCVVVIGHDCDLANAVLEAEPWVDVIVGRISEAFNGNFALGKAPRTLHLEMLREGKPVVVELVATAPATALTYSMAGHLRSATPTTDGSKSFPPPKSGPFTSGRRRFRSLHRESSNETCSDCKHCC
jgi:hypothetical protein